MEGLAFELTQVHTVACGWGFLLKHRKITSASEVDTRSMEVPNMIRVHLQNIRQPRGVIPSWLPAQEVQLTQNTRQEEEDVFLLPGAASPQLSIEAHRQPAQSKVPTSLRTVSVLCS